MASGSSRTGTPTTPTCCAQAIFDKLGYPKGESLPKLFDRVARDGGTVPGNKVIDQAAAFLTEQTGDASGELIDPTEQISRYVVWPGQATAYYVGMLKFLELRQKAKDQLGDRFASRSSMRSC